MINKHLIAVDNHLKVLKGKEESKELKKDPVVIGSYSF